MKGLQAFLALILATLLFNEYQPGIASGDATATFGSDNEGVFNTNHADTFDSFFRFDSKNHVFLQWFYKPFGQNRVFINSQSNAVTKNLT